jgi:transposase
MMGRQSKVQNKLFYTAISLEQRVRKNHILRKVKRRIDFDFIYNEVKDKYGINGNESVAPPIILKMMLLLTFYNVRSERELMATIPERLDWLWFLDYDLDDDIPDHSVLSKARTRWGVAAFKTFFERIVWQCVEAGLVDGRKLFMDSSMVQANASNNSVVNQESLKRYFNKSYQILESRLEQQVQSSSSDGTLKSGAANRKYISTTDPDASVTRRGKGKSKLKYQIHRGVDPKREVITATEVTTGEVHEAHRLESLIDTHEKNTEATVETAVADSKYGSIENYLVCRDRNIKPHFISLEEAQKGTGTKKGIFPKEAFTYNRETDTFTCPAGETLKRRKFFKKRQHYEYIASKGTCNSCQLKAQCTKAKSGRTLKRHIRQDDLDSMLRQAHSPQAKKDIITRQHLMERTFAQATRFGYQRARWRGLWRVQIQEYLTAAIQNIKILIKDVKEPAPALQMQVAPEVADTATTTKCYGLNNLFIPQKRAIVRLCLLVGKNLAYRPTAMVPMSFN